MGGEIVDSEISLRLNQHSGGVAVERTQPSRPGANS